MTLFEQLQQLVQQTRAEANARLNEQIAELTAQILKRREEIKNNNTDSSN